MLSLTKWRFFRKFVIMQGFRKIIHVDMDAFYASVEQRDNPQLRGTAIAIGHSDARGVVATASYEARKYGVRSAMPSTRALKLCPHLIFVTPRFDVYKSVSAQMHEIFHEYTDIVEPISLDEAFLDVTENKPGIDLAVDIAREIKAKIRERLGLTASAGVSYNKFLAKVASDFRKPDGLFTIHPKSAQAFIDRLPIEAFWGVGPVTAKKMHSLGITDGASLRECSIETLRRNFGKAGDVYYSFSRGQDERPVEPVRIRKSVGCETTLNSDATTWEEVKDILHELSVDLEGRIARSGFRGITLTLKVKFHDFTQITRSMSTDSVIRTQADLFSGGAKLFETLGDGFKPIRLLGLSVTNPSVKEKRTADAFRMESDWRQLLIDFESIDF